MEAAGSCGVFLGSLGVGAPAGCPPLMPAGQRLGDGPAFRLLDPMAAPAACPGVAGTRPAAFVVGQGMLEVGFAGMPGTAREGAFAVADLDQVAEQVTGLVAV